MKILLMGNPNVGKSAVFSRLTGADVVTSNYPGTTVEFTRGKMKLDGEDVEVIDVPGTYTLEPTSRVEEVAVKMVEELGDGDIVIHIVDSTTLERNLLLTLQLLSTGRKVIVALNMWDEARNKGIGIDHKKLEERLGVPVVPTCARSGEGIRELKSRIKEASSSGLSYPDEQKWQVIGNIVEEVQRVTHRHPTLGEKLGGLTVHPVWGIPFALLVLYITFRAIRFIGEGLIGYVCDPAFERLWLPAVEKLSTLLGPETLLHELFIGNLIEGEIDFMQSFGLFTTGLYIPFAAVLPYVFAFYLMLSFLEDLGYLPRLAILVDILMHRLGLHGLSIVPMMLGLGCNVPGALSTRILETRKERFIAATLMGVAVPCMAQIAMVVGLLGKYGPKGLGSVFGTLLILWLGLGMALKKLIRGETPEIVVDIPPYRAPYWGALAKKLWMRMRWFLTEAVPFVLLGVFVVNLLYSLDVIDFLGKLLSPVLTTILGLPPEAVGALIVGFLRKDVAVGMLAPLGLSFKQLIVASVVLCTYFPCVATFVTLFRELGLKDMSKATFIMVGIALSVGGLLNFLLGLIISSPR
ncbi:MAG TPA: ferrous iron transporter B [Candidatus Latescibacteria bacterium]|nr:ferrous iron transporter B [Candidatus Latescibacterota bacterium]